MKNYLDFEKEIKALENEVDGLKSPFGSEGISEVDTNKIKNTQTEINQDFAFRSLLSQLLFPKVLCLQRQFDISLRFHH